MKYDELVKAFNSAIDAKKMSVIEKHIVTDYVPYETKIAEANEIVKRAHYKEVQGKKVYMRNSPLAYQLFIIRLLVLYTDIEWEDADVLKMFNELTKNGLVDAIVHALPDNEYTAFDTVLKMVEDDDYENYRSLAGFLGTKIEALDLLLETLANASAEVVPSKK